MTDWEFVFDGVVGFLTSPIWNIPIVSFIEKHCIVFDGSDENIMALKEIHKEYSALVEELLTSYLKDVGISEEQFVMACDAGSTDNDQSKAKDRQSIFEQVWAGEDFEMFKSMMVKKNLDLELQALSIIQQRNGVLPKVFESEMPPRTKISSQRNDKNKEDELLKEVIKLSEMEYKKEKNRKKEIERMEKTLALSSKEESERLYRMAEDELKKMERMVLESLNIKDNVNEKYKNENQESLKDKDDQSMTISSRSNATITKPTKIHTKDIPTSDSFDPLSLKDEAMASAKKRSEESSRDGATKLKNQHSKLKSVPVTIHGTTKTTLKTQQNKTAIKADTPADAAKNWLSSAMAEAKTPSVNVLSAVKIEDKTSMDEHIAQRAQYMRIQREKLINLKKQERTKRLHTFEEDAPKRPMSSRVARRVTAGTETEKAPSNEMDEQQQKKLDLRRALAARLKKEVVNAE